MKFCGKTFDYTHTNIKVKRNKMKIEIQKFRTTNHSCKGNVDRTFFCFYYMKKKVESLFTVEL